MHLKLKDLNKYQIIEILEYMNSAQNIKTEDEELYAYLKMLEFRYFFSDILTESINNSKNKEIMNYNIKILYFDELNSVLSSLESSKARSIIAKEMLNIMEVFK